jgi:hypothetical protein
VKYTLKMMKQHYKEHTMRLLTENKLTIPPIDAAGPSHLETATFALG